MDETLLALFQIAVTNNWQDIMFINIVDGAKVNMWGSLFFIVYFVVVVWFGTNIMGAVVIEAYVTAVDRREKEGKARRTALSHTRRHRNSSSLDPNNRRRSSGAPPLLNAVESEFRRRLTRAQSTRSALTEKASGDLRNSEVLGMLQQEVDRTHESVRRNSVKISERLMSVGVGRGGNGGEDNEMSGRS